MKVPQIPGLGPCLKIVSHRLFGYDPSDRELAAFLSRFKSQSPRSEIVLRVVGNPGRVFFTVRETTCLILPWALRQALTLFGFT